MKSQRRRRVVVLLGMFVLAILVVAAAPYAGMKALSPRLLLPAARGEIDRDILLSIRVPRVLMAFLVGAGLSLSGMAFQAVFRNPLATPYTLGVSSGASLGAAIYLRLGLGLSLFGFSGISLAAFLGALMSVALVYGLTRLKGGFTSATLLLSGVAVSVFFSSVILFIQYASGQTQSFRIMRWMMGSLDEAGYDPVRNIVVFVALGAAGLFGLTHELNLLMTGEELAISRGVNVDIVKKAIFFLASLMIGAVVAFCGPIGFVGMMEPHICRLLIGSEHRYLTPVTLLFGGIFLVLCDLFSRVVIAPAEIPVGIITSLIGGPFFIWLLLNRKGNLEL